MKVDAFDFHLPDDRIATKPARPAESAGLLVVPSDGAFVDRTVGDLPGLLRAGDLLVFNDTKVVPAQLEGRRERVHGGETLVAKVGFTLHRRLGTDAWRAIARGRRKLRVGDALVLEKGAHVLNAVVLAEASGNMVDLRFECGGAELDAALALVGSVPLPPYITAKRPVGAADASDYQTMFAARDGAVAAPTAGLHFTPDLVARLKERGVGFAGVTLHVGAGTFLPVKVDDVADHRMHSEWGEIGPETVASIERARGEGGRVVSVGTTSLRILETAARDGLRPWSGETDIFITPGFEFRAVDVLMTNFHLPRSTLFMLVGAFAGLGRMQAAYAHAIERGYRFYSYGDANLLFRNG